MKEVMAIVELSAKSLATYGRALLAFFSFLHFANGALTWRIACSTARMLPLSVCPGSMTIPLLSSGYSHSYPALRSPSPC